MQRKRWAVAGTALALGALAACGGSGGSGGSGSSGGEGDANAPIKIGVYGPFAIEQGKDARDSALLAAEEISGKGGRKIEVVQCDSVDGAQPDKAKACAERFVQDKVTAIVGGFSSGETLAMLQTAVDGQVPYLSTGAAAPDVVKDVSSGGERKYIFRMGPLNSQALAADICLTYVGKLAPQAGFKKFGILYEDVEFARPLVKFLQACLPNPKAATGGKIPIDKGVELVGEPQKHAADATDFTSQFSALEQAGAEFVIEINSRQEGVALARAWGTLKPKFALGGINVSGQRQSFFDATGKKAAYQLNGPAGGVRTEANQEINKYFDAFNSKFGRDPIYTGGAAYDAVYAISEAAEKAGSIAPDDLVTELEKMDRVGVQGVEKFGPDHDIIYGGNNPKAGLVPVYFQWTPDGKQQPVFPKEYAAGYTYKKPPFAG